jgi:hypothetical protein
MEPFNKYQNGKIYKIWSLETDEIYVGSTCCPLYKRMFKHRESFRLGTKSHYKLYREMERLGEPSFRIELVEDYPCDSIDELHKREGFWIRELKASLNTRMAGRTKQEYYLEHLEETKEYKKKWQQENKDKLKEKHYDYYQKHKQEILSRVKENTKLHYDERKHYAKKYREENKEQIQAHKSETHICTVCGSTYTNCHKARHERTKKHMQALEQQS